MKELHPVTFENDDLIDDFRPKVSESDPKDYTAQESVTGSPPEKTQLSQTSETESNKLTESSIPLVSPQELKNSLQGNLAEIADVEKDQKEN